MAESGVHGDGQRRKDIDGLRALAVLTVVFFHLGWLKFGYLGVDVFFVISGFLIISAMYAQARAGRFSIVRFYLKRVRRILPLVLFAQALTLLVGVAVMLPDDLENLAQSVVATNFFANNVLQYITTGNYWEVVNEYKPLMHTWSLGIEEQFYIIIPALFLFFQGAKTKVAFIFVLLLSVLSALLLFLPFQESSKFYLLPFRFFELGLGGIVAIFALNSADLMQRLGKFAWVMWSLLLLLLLPLPILDAGRLVLVVCLTALLLGINSNAMEGSNDVFSRWCFQNPVVVWIGKISFSLYIWHQILLAFGRYFVLDHFGLAATAVFFVLLFLLSTLSYYLLEQPFQDAKAVGTSTLLWSTGVLFVCTTCAALYLYAISGILRSVPELDIDAHQQVINTGSGKSNTHIAYNARVYGWDRPFSTSGEHKIRVFVVGSSYARDFSNVLSESHFGPKLEIVYSSDLPLAADARTRFAQADYVFFSDQPRAKIEALAQEYGFSMDKVWNVGPKNFGFSNGIFYNLPRTANYFQLRTPVRPGFIEKNAAQKAQWGERHIDLLALLIDKDGKMPVFTPEHKYFSQDCVHLTHSGAKAVARLVDLERIFRSARP